MDIALMGETRNLYDWQPLMGAMIGAVYGAWVEVDDAPEPKAALPPAKETNGG
jgi:hypothetical protein